MAQYNRSTVYNCLTLYVSRKPGLDVMDQLIGTVLTTCLMLSGWCYDDDQCDVIFVFGWLHL